MAAPKTEAMLLINKNSDLVPGVQEVDDTITVQNARAQSTRDAIKAHAMSSGGGAVGGSSAVHSTPNIEEQNPLPAPRAVRESLLAGRVAAVATDDDRVAAVATDDDRRLLALRSRPNVKERHEDSLVTTP